MTAFVLRAVLVWCLVLGGIGNAMATARMATVIGGSGDGTTTMASEAPSDGGCDHGQAPAPATSVDDLVQLQPAGCDHYCCADGPCSCPCMQLGYAALAAVLMLSTASARATLAVAFSLGHASPALPDLIRPPIGP